MKSTTINIDEIGFSGPCHYLRPYIGSTRLVIFFGAKDLSFDKFNFFQTGRELPENCLFLNNQINHWYQYGVPGLGEDTAATINVIQHWCEKLNVQEIITIGTSMGGYGAIQYGSALGARVLAFATDAQLSTPYSQSKRYFVEDGKPSAPDLCALLKAKPTNVTLFAGERDIVDLLSAWRLSQLGCVQGISLVGADHVVPTHLSRCARLGPILHRFVQDGNVGYQPDAGEALTCKGYVAQTFAAFEASKKADWKQCTQLARTALKNYPCGEAANLLLGNALLRQNLSEDALAPLSLCVASKPDDLQTKAELANALRDSGAVVQAVQLHYQILEQKPDFHRSRYALGIIALRAGDLDTARQEVLSALRYAPSIKAYQERLVQIETRLAAQKPKPVKV